MSTDIKARPAEDRSSWGPGPWQDEPDRVEFEHLGFPCLIVRVPQAGHLCGYVAVPPCHPWHGKGYDDVPADVHGGLTYADKCQGNVCHVPKPGEPDDVWWLGFDHAHSGDSRPGDRALYQRIGMFQSMHDHDTYKTVEYVRAGCESLAHQAKEAA